MDTNSTFEDKAVFEGVSIDKDQIEVIRKKKVLFNNECGKDIW